MLNLAQLNKLKYQAFVNRVNQKKGRGKAPSAAGTAIGRAAATGAATCTRVSKSKVVKFADEVKDVDVGACGDESGRTSTFIPTGDEMAAEHDVNTFGVAPMDVEEAPATPRHRTSGAAVTFYTADLRQFKGMLAEGKPFSLLRYGAVEMEALLSNDINSAPFSITGENYYISVERDIYTAQDGALDGAVPGGRYLARDPFQRLFFNYSSEFAALVTELNNKYVILVAPENYDREFKLVKFAEFIDTATQPSDQTGEGDMYDSVGADPDPVTAALAARLAAVKIGIVVLFVGSIKDNERIATLYEQFGVKHWLINAGPILDMFVKTKTVPGLPAVDYAKYVKIYGKQ